MKSTYNFFRFLEDKKGKNIPFKYKLIHAPETLNKEDLHIQGQLDLSDSSIQSLPEGLKVGGDLYIRNTTLSEKYTNEELRKRIEETGGHIKGGIYL